jgi:hypothetical protein
MCTMYNHVKVHCGPGTALAEVLAKVANASVASVSAATLSDVTAAVTEQAILTERVELTWYMI